MDISNIDVEMVNDRVLKNFDILKENCSKKLVSNPSFNDSFSSICRNILFNYNSNYSIDSDDLRVSVHSTSSLEKNRFFVEWNSVLEDDILVVNCVYKNICELDTGKVYRSLELVDKYDKYGILLAHVEFERNVSFDEFSSIDNILDEHLIWNDYNYFPKVPKKCDYGRIQSIVRDPTHFGVARVVGFDVSKNVYDNLEVKYYMLNTDYPLSLCLERVPFMICDVNKGTYVIDTNRFGDIGKNDVYRLATTMYKENIENSDLINTNKKLFNYIIKLLNI